MFELVIETGADRGARHALPDEGEATIGRDVACTVALADERASRVHARLALARGTVTVEDLASRNGTARNGLPLVAGARTPLAPGDQLAIGDTVLVLRQTLGPERPAGRTTLVGRAALAGAGASDVDARRVLALVAALGARARSDLAGALREALEVAGGERAAIFAGSRLVAASHDEVPQPPELAPGAAAADLGALELEGGLTVVLSGEKQVLLVVLGRASSGAWVAVAAVLAGPVLGAVATRELADEADEARLALGRAARIVAESPAMRRLLAETARAAALEAPVLVLGESGSGKELVARALHLASPRARRKLVAANAAAFADSLIESELFGHERGAFTGAIARRKGIFELADGGTLFLDEVGELPLPAQAKLLRVLETGEVRPLGSEDVRRVDVRVVAATHRDLKRQVRDGRFREDLYFRLAVVELAIPPLRERPEDLLPLARHLLARRGLARVEVAPETLERLRAYPFPGNVRELRNVLERALLRSDGRTIRGEDLPPELRAAAAPDGAPFASLEDVERAHVEAALARTGWNRSAAARLLGIDRKTLYAKLKTYGLRADEADA